MSLPHVAIVDLKPVIEAFSGVSIYSRVFLKKLILAVYQISAVYVKKRISNSPQTTFLIISQVVTLLDVGKFCLSSFPNHSSLISMHMPS